jgi:hypothetical protein
MSMAKGEGRDFDGGAGAAPAESWARAVVVPIQDHAMKTAASSKRENFMPAV